MYVRVIEETSNIIGADLLGCEFEKVNALKLLFVSGMDKIENCQAKSNAQAWSSPIFVNSI